MPGNIIHLTTRKELQKVISQNNAFIIDVTATWCGPCKSLKPLLHEYFEQIKDKFDLVIIDADDGADAASYLKVRSYPTLISYVNHERSECLVGFDVEGLKHFIVQSYKKAVYA